MFIQYLENSTNLEKYKRKNCVLEFHVFYVNFQKSVPTSSDFYSSLRDAGFEKNSWQNNVSHVIYYYILHRMDCHYLPEILVMLKAPTFTVPCLYVQFIKIYASDMTKR
jgi:hypothetical protein